MSLLAPSAFTAALLLFYGPGKWVLGKIARACLQPCTRYVSIPPSDLEQIIRLVLAILGQAGLLLCFLAVFHLRLRWADRAGLLLVPLAALLGAAEMLASRFICEVVIRADLAISGGRREIADWRALAKAGWLRSYSAAFRRLPAALAGSLLVGYVTGEEAVFRGVAIAEYGRFGEYTTVALSTVMFTVVQVFRMPNWRSASFPVVGGAVVGLVHALLYMHGTSLLPLIVAHVAFFMLSTSVPGTDRPRPTTLARKL
jgi:hypothetical protein